MRFLAAPFLVVAALTSPVLAQLDTTNVNLDEWKSSNLRRQSRNSSTTKWGRVMAYDVVRHLFGS